MICLDEAFNIAQFLLYLGAICLLPTDITGLPHVWMKHPVKLNFTTRYVSIKHVDIPKTKLDSVPCKK
jgi:hypothetical protein